MQFPLIFVLLCNLVAALPLQPPASDHQQPLLAVNPVYVPSSTSNQHLERVPKSVEVLFTASDDDQMIHVWLPLGKRMHPRDFPILPLHPTTARILDVSRTSNGAPVEESRRRVMCVVTPKVVEREREAYDGEGDIQDSLAVSFQGSDGLADLEDADSAWFLAAREVDSYECF